MSHDVFISYSSKDKTVADAVVSTLENENIRCWYAPRDIQPGADWGESITEAIHDCKIFLLIFSNNSNQSKRVLDEVYYAISEEKAIIPFRIENLVPTGAMSLHLSSKHWLDAYDPSWSSHLNRLSNSLKVNLGREATFTDDEVEESPPPPHVAKAAPKKNLPWLWISLAIVFALILTTTGIIWATNRTNQVTATPTSSVSVIETKEVVSTEANVEEPVGIISTPEEDDGWEVLNFMIPNPEVWDTSEENSYKALGPSDIDSFAWSTETFEGDLMVRLELERIGSRSDGCVIVYGGGHEFSYGSLIFCVDWDGYGLEKHTKYHEGENFLSFSKRDNESVKDFSVTIEIVNDIASMYVDGEKVLSTFFDPEEIEGSGRIGLWKNWSVGVVVFSNIQIKIPNDADQSSSTSEIEEDDCDLDSGGHLNFYPLKSPFISHSIEVDGSVSSAEEWSDAACVDLRMHYSTNVTNPNFQRVRWWVQNNEQEISFLIRVPIDLALRGVFVDYFWPEYTGAWAYSDGFYANVDGEFDDHGNWDELQWYEDTDMNPPGTIDGESAYTKDDEFHWFEIKRPLNSGDPNDWNWQPGQTYGDNPYDSILVGIVLEEGEFMRYLQLEIGAP